MSELQNNAMLARLKVRMWTASKSEAKLNREAETRHNAQHGTVASYKSLMKSDPIDAFKKASAAAKAVHTYYTLPWMDGGVRILPVSAYDDFTAEYRVHRDECEKAKFQIRDTWDAELDHAKSRLGDLFNPADFPSKEVVIHRFDLDLSMWPVPDASDWRADVGDAERAKIEHEIETRMNLVAKQAMSDVWKRVYECIEHMHDILKDPDRVIRDSLMENAGKLIDVLPKLNIADDPQLEKMRQDIKLDVLSKRTDDLRHNDAVRQETARKTQEILRKLAGVYDPQQSAA